MKQEKKRSLNPKVKGTLDKKVKTAQQELETYLKANKLDPSKDHSKDKKHGAKIRELIAKVNVAREQVKDAAPKEIGKAERTEIRAKEKAEKAMLEKSVTEELNNTVYHNRDGIHDMEKKESEERELILFFCL